MASSARMMIIGIVWITSMFALTTMAFIGSLVLTPIQRWFMTIHMVPVMQESAGTIWWVFALYYVVILIFAIVITYRCYQEVIVVTDYFPDTGVN